MNTNQPITILIVSDNHLVRSGLRRILETHSRIAVIAEASIREATVAGASLRPHPEIVLIDLEATGTGALTLISRLKKILKNAVVLVMSDLSNEGQTRRALEIGAAGVVLKSQPPSVLIAAVESLFSRSTEQMELRKVEPERTLHRTHNRGHAVTEEEMIESLTERERDIVALIAGGLKNKDIAEQLYISDITVRHHLTNIFIKLGVSNRQKLLLLAHRHGLAKLTVDSQMS